MMCVRVGVCECVCAWLKFHFNVIGITQKQAGETLMKCIVKWNGKIDDVHSFLKCPTALNQQTNRH